MVGKAVRVVAVAILLACSSFGCSEDDDDGGDGAGNEMHQAGTCNAVTGSQMCTEIGGSAETIEYEKTRCEEFDTWTTEPCPAANVIGCCSYSLGRDEYLECYYAGFPQAVAEIEVTCHDFNGTWSLGAP